MEKIIEYIDDYLRVNNLIQIDAVTANAILAKAGILRDSVDRLGKPLRELLRKNKIPHAFQNGRNWIIPKSDSKVTFINKQESDSKYKTAKKDSFSKFQIKDDSILPLKFKGITQINAIPALPGIYCLKIKEPSLLPEIFCSHLIDRGHDIIYIGLAKNLKRRLNQELFAKGHGTFFRSLGAVLGYRPEQGSLLNKINKKNFKFSAKDEQEIIKWIVENIELDWILIEGDLNFFEGNYIRKYKPLLNIDKNPLKLLELSTLRAECVEIANSMNFKAL
ncbi:hypothetical protein FMM05_12845 [Flavobacterium zepuense]|uniref:GIY-YIG domain-containing protein n=1 Tax=Flavobacterium zepuense TaxID=2593302 RepID=A0A552UZ86_9FLAO|nr:hypothetical protein [Flavobacterium zepuense]TRW23543.1 hypothetical protein FMM05_12845 [Flavobacterium zepuense]